MKQQKMKGLALLMAMLVSIIAAAAVNAAAPQDPYAGSFLERSTLTGDWGGARSTLAGKGVEIDLSLTQFVQGITSGGKNYNTAYDGRGNLTVNLDTQKLGLWPGGFFAFEAEGNYGKSVNFDTGALTAVNSSQLYPMPTNDNFDIPEVSFMQFLTPKIGIVVGKLDTTSGDDNEFAHGKGDFQFFNLAFNLNPATVLITPYSTLGAGLVIIPTGKPDDGMINLNVLQTNGKANTSGFSDLDSNKLTFAGQGRMKTNFFGLTGHQLIGFVYSNMEFASLDQSMRFIVDTGQIEKENGSWVAYYNFDQYFYEPKKGSGNGIGVFGRFGITDGDANPIRCFYSIGLGGKGVIPARPLDSFGIGYYYIDVSNPTYTVFSETKSLLRDEQGIEAFYNVALTPWMQLTPDIQVIKPAQKQDITVTHDSRGIPIVDKTSINNAVVMGCRLELVF